jgi:hypothetical protein
VRFVRGRSRSGTACAVTVNFERLFGPFGLKETGQYAVGIRIHRTEVL